MIKKNILITGSTGLIGKNFIKIFSKKYNIYQISKKSNKNKIFKYDLSKIQNFKKLPDNFDILIYLAQSNNYQNPKVFKNEILNINFKNFRNLCNKLKKGKQLKHIIYASSGNVYQQSNFKIYEHTNLKNINDNVYSQSKLLSENYLENIKSKNITFFIARIFFAYGCEQKKNMLIKSLIAKVKSQDKIFLNGFNGIKINPIHAIDVCKILDKSIKNKISGIFNLAGPQVLSIKDICLMISKKLKKPTVFIIKEKSFNIVSSINKIKKFYAPKITIDKKINTIINY